MSNPESSLSACMSICETLAHERDVLKSLIARYHAAREHLPRAVNEGTSKQASAAVAEVNAAREAMYRAAGIAAKGKVQDGDSN